MAHIEIEGYKFTTEAEGQEAQQSLNDYYGIPAYPDAETIQYTDLSYPTTNGEYYFQYADGMEDILGLPETIILPDDIPI